MLAAPIVAPALTRRRHSPRAHPLTPFPPMVPCRYRFLELKYNRDAETSKSGRVLSARVETVVVLLPDVSSCVPDASQWQHSVADYMRTEGAAPGSVEAEDAAAAAEDAAAAEVKQPVDGENNVCILTTSVRARVYACVRARVRRPAPPYYRRRCFAGGPVSFFDVVADVPTPVLSGYLENAPLRH